MKLKEFLEYVEEMVNEHPEYLEFELINASDDEGNSFQKVHNYPLVCKVADLNEYFLEVEEVPEDEQQTVCNAICIN